MYGRMVRWITGAVVAAAVAAVGVAPAGATGSSTPVPLTCEPGTAPQAVEVDVVLTRDLTCAHGFFVPQGLDHPVSIDLGNRTLSVPGATCGAPGTCVGLHNFAEVSGGRVVAGISNATSVHHVWVDGTVWMASAPGAPDGASLTHAIVTGPVRYFGGADGRIEANVLLGGLAIANDLRGLDGLTVTGNWVLNSPTTGIALQANLPSTVSATITRNIVWGSAGHGIDLAGAVFLYGDVEVTSNLVFASHGDGIRVLQTSPGFYPAGQHPGPVTLTDNASLGNQGHGIDASWSTLTSETGMVDGGGNRAVYNATAPSCIGVTCTP